MKKEYYQLHRDEILEKKHKYDLSHRKENSEREKLRYSQNREKLKARSRAYHHAHKEKCRDTSRRWRKAHPEESRISKIRAKHKRRALEYATRVDEYGMKQWMKEVRSKPFARCHWCGTKVKGRTICFDHIIAISKGGTHTIGNLCACCRSCNSTKHDREIANWIRNGQTFLAL